MDNTQNPNNVAPNMSYTNQQITSNYSNVNLGGMQQAQYAHAIDPNTAQNIPVNSVQTGNIPVNNIPNNTPVQEQVVPQTFVNTEVQTQTVQPSQNQVLQQYILKQLINR